MSKRIRPQNKNTTAHPHSVTTFQASSGPLPPPQVLEQYERISPGLAQNLITLMNDEAVHRRKIESGLLNLETMESRAKTRESLLSLFMGGSILLTPMGASIYFISQGQSIEGAVAFLGGCAALLAGKKIAGSKKN